MCLGIVELAGPTVQMIISPEGLALVDNLAHQYPLEVAIGLVYASSFQAECWPRLLEKNILKSLIYQGLKEISLQEPS